MWHTRGQSKTASQSYWEWGASTSSRIFKRLFGHFRLFVPNASAAWLFSGRALNERNTNDSRVDLGTSQNIFMPGFDNNPFAWMRVAAVFVSTSLSEGCPNALMQALCCGTPVVSTDCAGGSSEILQSGKWGRLVTVGDHQAIADAIKKSLDACNHPDGRQRAKDFSLGKITGQYLEVLFPGSQISLVQR